MKRSRAILFLLLFMLTVGSASAADMRYKASGDWFDIDPTDGAGWNDARLPGVDDTARANWGNNTRGRSLQIQTIEGLTYGRNHFLLSAAYPLIEIQG